MEGRLDDHIIIQWILLPSSLSSFHLHLYLSLYFHFLFFTRDHKNHDEDDTWWSKTEMKTFSLSSLPTETIFHDPRRSKNRRMIRSILLVCKHICKNNLMMSSWLLNNTVMIINAIFVCTSQQRIMRSRGTSLEVSIIEMIMSQFVSIQSLQSAHRRRQKKSHLKSPIPTDATPGSGSGFSTRHLPQNIYLILDLERRVSRDLQSIDRPSTSGALAILRWFCCCFFSPPALHHPPPSNHILLVLM